MASEASTIEGATYPRGFARDTDWKWPMFPARKLVALNYGRALKADTRRPGKIPVFGTNGQCGWHDVPLAKAPGLILGRKGQGPLGVEWCDKDFWVIDTGEYRGFFGEHVMHCHIGSPVALATGSLACALPPTTFVESDFVALFEPAGKVQGPKMRAAIRSLRLAALRPELATQGIILKKDQPKAGIFTALKDEALFQKLDEPSQEFNVLKLARQIEEECVFPDGRRWDEESRKMVTDPSKWGPESGDFSYCLSLVSRITAIVGSAAFRCVFRAKETPLTSQIGDFISGEKRLLRICLSGVAYEFRVFVKECG